MNDDSRTLRILFNKAIDDFQGQVTATESQLNSQISQTQSDLANTKSQLVTAQGQISTGQTQLTQLSTSVSALNASAAAAAATKFTYNAAPGAPVITGITPVTGSPAGGDTITITGTGFTGVTAVSFGLTPAASFTFISDTQITAVSPPGSGPVNISVTTPLGKSTLPAP